uniref:Toll-like receptor 13 n=1 Tax=Crassostrea virginica TaxID=6565 RepID=A0A8B8B4D8_CRAVI|nr:toll-like receptor 13 [Crassostrea virginica]XP_022297529.1 toll-like receptor 13 [Crassostrea virginica]
MDVLPFLVHTIGILVVLDISVNGCTYDHKCNCSLAHGTWYADCSDRGLVRSPKFWPNVTRINLSRNKLKSLPERSLLPDILTHFDLSNNEIATFRNNAFQQLWKLTSLRLDGNALRVTNDLNSSIFEDLLNIKYLDLSNNPELTLRVMPILTRGIQNSTIEILRPNRIQCTFGVGAELRIEDVRFLKYTNLKEVYLSSNRIEQIENGAPYFFPQSLEKVSVADNLFTFGLYIFEVISLQNLKWLNMSLQQMPHSPVEVVENILHFCVNKRRNISDMEVYPSNETIKHAQEMYKAMSTYNFTIPVPPNLEIIYAEEMGLRYVIPKLEFSQNTVKELYMQGNTFYRWAGPIIGINHLRLLNLSNNFCSNVSRDFFSHIINLSELYISNNLLGFSIASDIDGRIFENLLNLRHIDLKANRIAHLPFMVFKSLKNLQHLDLSNNLLTTVEFDILKLKALKYLDLSGNQIQAFAESTRNNISLLKEETNISLNLLSNPLRCDCKTLDFLQWMVKERKLGKIRFPHFRDYTCTKSSSDRKVLKFINIEIQIEELIKQCSSYTTLVFIIASLIILFLAVLSAGLIYRVRWKLRYFYYMTKSRYHGYKAVRGDDQSDFKYDAFVSYADEDRKFVLKMISKLEGEKNIRLCIHHRDFVPGYDIAENIITAVNKSKKTIIILSPNYIKSSWCMYELHIAKMEEIYSREKESVLFLIFYEAVPADIIPLKIMDVINQKSYIEFPNDEYGNTVFWNRLGEALM